MREIELIDKRKPREKHYLQEDGTIIAKVYSEDIHFKKNGKFEEIDNTLVNVDGEYCNKNNDYTVKFQEESTDSLMRMEKDGNYLDISLRGSNCSKIKVSENNTKLEQKVKYSNILDDISIEYKTLPTKVKETIILKSNKYSKIDFVINTNMELVIEDNCIVAKNKDKTIFKVEAPYMEDAEGKLNNNIYYHVKKHSNHYDMELVLDEEWLNSLDIKYPVYIDPTISNEGNDITLYDTYIYQGDSNDDRNSKSYLKAGVEKINGVNRVNRTLIKFTLPEIGTGSEVVYSELYVVPYLKENINQEYKEYLMECHAITSDWNDTTANWDSMNDKYQSRIESVYPFERSELNNSELIYRTTAFDITNIMKKWYRDTPNYGVMIKSCDESYIDNGYPMFFSSQNTVSGNPKPLVEITYRNLNGLESYMDYKQQSFMDGASYINTYNGNITALFRLGNTIGGVFPAVLNLVYNTNDVVLNNQTFFKKGYKLNLEQFIKEDGNKLQFIDDDGTIHYFSKKSSDYFSSSDEDINTFYDEDGLNLNIKKETSSYLMTDEFGIKKTFTLINNKYILTRIDDTNGNFINILLNSNNSIKKIVDGYENAINITYNLNEITITSVNCSTSLKYENNLLKSITTLNGITTFEYNDDSIITSITDPSGLKIKYEYYDIRPYKAKKVTQYSTTENIGQYFTLEYGMNCTTLIDNKNKAEVLSFNDAGNLLSKSNLKSINNLSDAYSIKEEYNGNNNIVSNIIPLKYINNLLKNTSFEGDSDYFLDENGITKSFDTNNFNSGIRSLKIESTMENKSIKQNVVVEKGKYYTFSGYIKNDINAIISLSYIDESGNEIIKSEDIGTTDEFKRSDVSIFYDNSATSNLIISITLVNIGSIFIDDIQLEEGEVANYYNILENSNFSSGFSDWTSLVKSNNVELNYNDYMQIININEAGDKALKINMNPYNQSSITKKFDIKGKKGDLYTLSFWYKYDGITQYAPNTASNITIFYEPYNSDFGHCIGTYLLPKTSENAWQYYIHKEIAIEDFKSITIHIYQNGDANELCLTNLAFYKNVTSGEYKYDDKGNLVSIENQNKSEEKITYDNKNRITSITNNLDNHLKYEYDIEKPNQILNVYSDNGIVNEITYNQYGNPIKMITSNKHPLEINDGIFKIRMKGTKKFFKAELNSVILEENQCSNTLWNIEKVGEKYKIKYLMNSDYSISYNNGNIILDDKDQNNLFSLFENEDDSYSIFYETIDNNIPVSKYFYVNNDILSTKTKNGDESGIEFYIEKNNTLFTEISYTYSDDNKFISSFVDNNLKETIYNYNSQTGLLDSVINPNGDILNYQYNDKMQIKSSNFNGRKIEYEYNEKNLLSKVIQGSKIFKIQYDDFLNIKKIMLGDIITFIENNYEDNNGNLLSIQYGNGNQTQFIYDNFDRVSKMIKMTNSYLYKYDNNGNLSKIISDDGVIKYYYDESNRLYKYKNENYSIEYKYDSNNNIICKTFEFDNEKYCQNLTYDEFENPVEFSEKNIVIDYTYDELNRSIKKQVGTILNYIIDYETNGKRTSNIIKNYFINNQKYSYQYDNLNNIVDIYSNNELIKHYDYDNFGELICEINYDDNTKINYIYDTSGNILKKTLLDTVNDTIIKEYNYTYSNLWEDQLLSFDGEVITYDSVGNPVSIDTAQLSWIDGNSLHSYVDSGSNVYADYKYNLNGIRISKNVNSIHYDYKINNNNDIIFERRDNNVIYYTYDIDGIVSMTYNGCQYFYIKNMQDDIIGIMNANGEQLVSYKYDSWGNLLSIKDGNGNSITDNNNIGRINPFRYRSYYYDEETNLYYLNNRYYNPRWGRFISPDTVLGSNQDILSCNLYSYVSNNPINNYDNNGTSLKSLLKKVKSVVKKVVKKVVKAITSVVKKIIPTPTPTVKKNNNSSNNLPDYSNELNRVLHNNATEANYYSKVLSPSMSLDYFKDQVNHNAEWDYKRETQWEKDIHVTYLGTKGEFMYNGEVTTAEDFGNIHFGYVGTAMGFSEEILYMGGGYAHCGQSIKVFIGPYYCDDPNDHKAIKRGIQMYKDQQ